MKPQLSAPTVRQAIAGPRDELDSQSQCRRCRLHARHPITRPGSSDLASSDMMSLETRQRVWQARLDPRRQTPSSVSIRITGGLGISMRNPLLNDRQVGVAIEGVLRQESIDITQLAVDSHGTPTSGCRSHAAGFDMCPR